MSLIFGDLGDAIYEHGIDMWTFSMELDFVALIHDANHRWDEGCLVVGGEIGDEFRRKPNHRIMFLLSLYPILIIIVNSSMVILNYPITRGDV